MGFVQILVYLSLLVFVVAVIIKAARYAKTPIHLRWELYPVAHEKGRAHYGGSIFEESEWWTKPREVDRVNELREMSAEILFLKGVYHHNRKLWNFSFPFHFGLYLLIGWLVMLVVGAILSLAGVEAENIFVRLTQLFTIILGYAGLGLTGLGALGLLIRRLNSDEMRKFNAPAEYFNLIFFIVAMVVGILVHLTVDSDFGQLRAFIASLISFQPAVPLAAALKLEIVLGSLLIAYIPLTRMVHFVGKYFLYHDVRWSDDPNLRGGKIEARLKQAFNYGVSWQGPHVQSGKSWAQVATEEKE